MIDLRLLIQNGVHFGHQTAKWSPKMAPYIWGFKNGIHLIDVSKTAQQLEKAAKFLEGMASQGKTILFVGTKKAAAGSIRKVAEELKLPFVAHRWVGGTFTNYRQVRKAIANMMDSEEILKKSDTLNYTKKELNLLKKRTARLENIVGGIRHLSWPVGAVVVVDVKKENVVIKEARASGIPVVALVDTNCDPTNIDYVIPANDDAPRSIELLITYLGEAIARGQKVASNRPKSEIAFEETLLETLFVDEEEDALAPKKVLKPKPKKVEVELEVVARDAADKKLREAPKAPGDRVVHHDVKKPAEHKAPVHAAHEEKAHVAKAVEAPKAALAPEAAVKHTKPEAVAEEKPHKGDSDEASAKPKTTKPKDDKPVAKKEKATE